MTYGNLAKDSDIMETKDISIKDIHSNNKGYLYRPFHIGSPTDIVAVVIDGEVLPRLTRNNQSKKIDYKKLNDMFLANFPGLRSTVFIITEVLNVEDPSGKSFEGGYSAIRGLLTWMRNNRYTVISRQVMKEKDIPIYEAVSPDDKMDVEITSALYRAARYADHIIFVGNSRKFVTPLKDLKENQGKLITVLGAKRPENTVALTPTIQYTSEELCGVGNFVDIRDKFFDCIQTSIPRRQSERVKVEEEYVEVADTNEDK